MKLTAVRSAGEIVTASCRDNRGGVALWRCVLAAGLMTGFLLAETQAPLRVEPAELGAAQVSGQTPRTFQRTNESTKMIKAYVLVIGQYGEAGKPAGVLASTGVTQEILPMPGAQTAYEAAETWPRLYRHPHRAGGSPRPGVVRVDYALFEDGSFWGPGKARMSLYFQGIEQARRVLTPAPQRCQPRLCAGEGDFTGRGSPVRQAGEILSALT